MTTLSDAAFEHLKKIQVKLLPLKPVTGSSFNVGEYAVVYAEITNTTGLPLRDLVVETMIWGSAADYQPFYSWDGNGGTIDSLEPGEVWKNYIAFIVGKSTGSFTMLVKVGAEVVPFSSIWPTYTTYAVQAAP
ncbi:MAG TPA: hypothetical protein VFZ72_01750 [Jiangellaceae bacterium]